jgi:hypothetical protein
MRGECFALSTIAMAAANTIDGWTRQNYRTAIRGAINNGWLRTVRSAPGQPSTTHCHLQKSITAGVVGF